MNKLIVAEKPSVALRLAMALGESRQKTEMLNGIRYFVVDKGADKIFIVAAAGHLFTLTQSGANKTPVFDIEWVPSYKVSTGAYFTKKYIDAIEIVAKQCSFFINACDYDIEGTVIGTNIIKYVMNKNANSEMNGANVRRMRFSTTTNEDLIQSYTNLNDYDGLNFDAGEARHKLDWMWGINMSRALMAAISSKGVRKTMSIGRVQGPALGILSKRENDIKGFVPKPYWKILLNAKGVDFEAKESEIFDKAIADAKFSKAKTSEVKVKSVESQDRSSRPFPPFDLTSLQIEANRVFRIDPSRTLAIAQVLYERSYISYPRTSSQKLPHTINLPRIINALAKIPKYMESAQKLIKESRFRPAEGGKEDDAHPAIHPTGEEARKLSEEEEKIYDLITRRFLACFGDYSTSELKKVSLDVGGDEYRASGEKSKHKGWLDIYKYYAPKELQMPDFTVGEMVKPSKVDMKALKTLPPKRYTKASLISLLEGKDLGTKATRAEIIDTLFKRGYINGSSIEVTEFGLSVYTALSTYCPDILDEDLTRTLEKDMERIQKGEKKKIEVITEGKNIITKLISEFKGKENQIGDELLKGLKNSENSSIIGVCKVDGGNLILRRSKMGKNFIGCSNWPKCTNTYSVPQNAKIVSTGKVCELCKTPKIKVFRKGKRPFEMDLDPNCETKKDWAKPANFVQGAKTGAALPSQAKPAAPAQPNVQMAQATVAVQAQPAPSKVATKLIQPQAGPGPMAKPPRPKTAARQGRAPRKKKAPAGKPAGNQEQP